MNKYTALDILDAKEKRVNFQSDLRDKYKLPMISMRVNFPGEQKDNELSRNISSVMFKELKTKFKDSIQYENYKLTAEGPVVTLILNISAKDVKKKSIEIEENHLLGRCVDIDVYDESGQGISRTNLGYKPRKCFLCDDEAKYCVRARKHNLNEIVDFIEKKYDAFIHNNI